LRFGFESPEETHSFKDQAVQNFKIQLLFSQPRKSSKIGEIKVSINLQLGAWAQQTSCPGEKTSHRWLVLENFFLESRRFRETLFEEILAFVNAGYKLIDPLVSVHELQPFFSE
jgi:hypothetical protein